MLKKLAQFRDHVGRARAGHPPLRQVDADRAVFSGVVHLHNAIT
jgi:hypothetical protein